MHSSPTRSFRETPTNIACIPLPRSPFRHIFFDITDFSVTLCCLAQGQGSKIVILLCMTSADVRVRIRPTVVRVRIRKTGIRPVIRVTTPQHQLSIFAAYRGQLATTTVQPATDFAFPFKESLCDQLSSAHYLEVPIIGKTSADRRGRTRPTEVRARTRKTGIRPVSRATTPQHQLSSS